MKKLFAILAIAGTLAACNNGDDKASTAMDSTKMVPATEAKKTADTAAKSMADTASKMINKMADTANKMMKDAANKMVEKAKEAVKH